MAGGVEAGGGVDVWIAGEGAEAGGAVGAGAGAAAGAILGAGVVTGGAAGAGAFAILKPHSPQKALPSGTFALH